MSFFNRIANSFLKTMEKRAAIRVHQHMQLVDPVALSRAGISLELFALGPAAYPWRKAANPTQASAPSRVSAAVTPLHRHSDAEIRLAIAELRSCSDAELADLGIARGDIARAVRDGRPGIDRPLYDQDHHRAA